MQKIGIDYLRFGRALRQTDPELYEKLNWQNIYPDVPVTFKVDVRLPGFGVSKR